MDAHKVDLFMATNAKYFEFSQVPVIREMLLALDEEKGSWIQGIELKDPTMALIVSLLGGTLGIDRFYIGDIGLGFAKLFTLGGCGVWAIVDLFLIMGATRRNNFIRLQQAMAL